MTHISLIKVIIVVSLSLMMVWPIPQILYADESVLMAKLMDEEDLLFTAIPSVYGASKYDQKVTETPSHVSVVTAEEIQVHGYRTLAEILESLNGVYLTYDYNYHYAGVRGFSRPGDYNSRLLLLVNGTRVNDPIFDAALIGTAFQLDVDLIERVEFVRGPTSSLYGTNAFFGVVNVIVKRGRDFQTGECSGDIGENQTYKGRLSYGKRYSKSGLEVLLSCSLYDSKGKDQIYFNEFDGPETNNGIVENADSDRNFSLFSQMVYSEFTLEALFSNRGKKIPTASYGSVFNDSRTGSIDLMGYLYLKYEDTLLDNLDVMGKLTYGNYIYRGDYAYDYSETTLPDIVINRDNADAQWVSVELQAAKELYAGNKVLVGLDYQNNFRQDQSNHDRDGIYLESKQQSFVLGTYIQDDLQLLQSLRLNMALRSDYYSTFGHTFNPRFALIYQPIEKTIIKVLYGKAFRAPSAFELYYHDGDETQKANANLKPEQMRTYEVTLDQYIADSWHATLMVYDYSIQGLISLATDPNDGLLVFGNGGTVRSFGTETKLEWHRKGLYSVGLTHTWQEIRDAETKVNLSNAPHHILKFNSHMHFLNKKLTLAMEEYFVSPRLTITGQELDAYFTTNITILSEHLFDHVTLSLSGYNIFNQSYAVPASNEHVQDALGQQGRSWRVKATYLF